MFSVYKQNITKLIFFIIQNGQVCVTDCELAHIGHAAVQGEDKDDGTHGFQGAPDI
jgi:hypothetical protein